MKEHTVEVKSKGVTWIVSEAGQVRVSAHSGSFIRTRLGKTKTIEYSFPERSITSCIARGRGGYVEVATMIARKRIRERVHRLVALAFVPGYQTGLTVNHKNGIKSDNRPENLEWVSLARNTQHQWETGLVEIRGEDHPMSKLTSKQVVYIRRLLGKGVTRHELSVVLGLSFKTIEKIMTRETWNHLP